MASDLYSFASIISLSVIIIIFIQHLTMKIGDKMSKRFNMVLSLALAFTIVDALWGLTNSGFIPGGVSAVTILTYLFHLLALAIAFGWYQYSSKYLEFAASKVFEIILFIPLLLGIALLVANRFNGCIFTVGSDGMYHVGEMRYVLFVLELFYAVISLIRGIIRFHSEQDSFKRSRYAVVLAYVLILLVMGTLQIFMPIVPCYSTGWMLACLIVFVGNITMDRAKAYEDSSEHYKAESKEMFQAMVSLAGSYVSIHRFDLPANKCEKIRSQRYIDRFINPLDGGAMQIRRAMEGTTHPDMVDEVVEFVDLSTLPTRMRDKEIISMEFMGHDERWCMASFIRIEDDTVGKPVKVMYTVQNIDESKRREMEYQRALKEALENKNEIYAEMLRMQVGGVIATDLTGEIMFINDAATKMIGEENRDAIKGHVSAVMDRITLDNYDRTTSEYMRVISNGGHFSYYASSVNYKGNQIYLKADVKLLEFKNGQKVIITSLADITANKEIEDKLTVLSETDALTGINNRGSGEKKTVMALHEGTKGMFCLVDANNFKEINDTYGHQTGDKALITIADGLRACFREEDIVMRLGGDEFAVFAKNILDKESAKACIGRFFDRLSLISLNEMRGEKISVSLGAVFTEDDGKESFDRLYSKADSVMYLCKDNKTTCQMAFYEVH